jgi:hypothetical protein
VVAEAAEIYQIQSQIQEVVVVVLVVMVAAQVHLETPLQQAPLKVITEETQVHLHQITGLVVAEAHLRLVETELARPEVMAVLEPHLLLQDRL